MSAKRLYYALGIIALLAILTLAARAAFGAVEAQQNSQIDSATRSYMAWAQAIADQRNIGIDSATRAYMAWAHYIEERQQATGTTVTP